MKTKAFFFVLISFFIFILNSSNILYSADSTGDNFLELADNYKNFADFDKAITFCDKAITIFNATKDKTQDIRRSLSKAHYLKANLFNYTQAGDEKIESELFKAMIADPDYAPLENYSNHPTIQKLLKQTQAKYDEYINTTFDKAMVLFTEEKYCLAKEMLTPIAHRHKNSKFAGNILKRCETKCIEGLKSDEDTSSEEQNIPPLPVRTGPIKNAIGIIPLLFEGDFPESRKDEFREQLTPELVKKSFKKFQVWLNAPSISLTTLDQLKKHFSIDDYNHFVINPSSLNINSAIMGIIQGKIERGIEENLNPHLQDELEKVFNQLGYEYLFFSKITKNDNITEKSNFKQHVTFNLYVYGKYDSPLLIKRWGIIVPRQFFITRDDIARNISEILSENIE